MVNKRSWSTAWEDVYGKEYEVGDIVKARVLVGNFWKDVIGQIIDRYDGLALKGKDFNQSIDFVNSGEIIGNIVEHYYLLEEVK